MRDYLTDSLPDKWTGRGSVTFQAPMQWPPRSPDLTTSDNSSWRCIKDVVSKQCCHSNDELKTAVTAAFGKITTVMLKKMFSGAWCCIILCSENETPYRYSRCTRYINV